MLANLLEFEAAVSVVREFDRDPSALERCERAFFAAVRGLIATTSEETDLCEILAIASTRPTGQRRDLAMFFIRVIGVTSELPSLRIDGFDRIASKLFEDNCPDLMKQAGFDSKDQTFFKIQRLEALADEAYASILPLGRVQPDVQAFKIERQRLLKLMNDKLVCVFYRAFGMADFRQATARLVEGLVALAEAGDIEFHERLGEAKAALENLGGRTSHRPDPLGVQLAALHQAAASAIEKLEAHSAERFFASITTKHDGHHLLPKRYPLHEPGKKLDISIPLTNVGPGWAREVQFSVISDEAKLHVTEAIYNVGDVSPGDFALTYQVEIIAAVSEATMLVEVCWKSGMPAARFSEYFEFFIQGQDSNIDWRALEWSAPYSPAVAEGREFVGRAAKIKTLATRIIRTPMESSYIYGQKRIGKTSLAKAVIDFVRRIPSIQVATVYLEWGDYARPSAVETVSALGYEVALQIASQVPGYRELGMEVFRGSLSPLNDLANRLLASDPDLKVLVVLDEFDELHLEMYRFGPLAESFFSNLRTLSGKRNFALLLVGGEKMPFIIHSQGDQLNRFVSERLDYYKRDEEWIDYVALVREPSAPHLVWHDSAVNELFYLTNGHPYFTKLICQRAFHNAVAYRDAEITREEVTTSASSALRDMDTNPFAHFWKDGIQADPEEAEVIALRRCRLLTAVARLLRQKIPVTVDGVINRKDRNLAAHEVNIVMADFCRRGILQESGGAYHIVVPLFKEWLRDNGYSRLVADTLGDEFEDALREADEHAYVKPSELVELVTEWPTYRGRRISADEVRAWLEQVPNNIDRRILFKLLQNVIFFGEDRVREMLRTAHSIVRTQVSAATPGSRVRRLTNVLVTYLDGEGRSGQYYAARYAEENFISTACITSLASFSEKLAELDARSGVRALVVVDDIIASGGTMSGNLESFLAAKAPELVARNLLMLVVVLTAVKTGEDRVRTTLLRFPDVRAELRVCHPILAEDLPFAGKSRMWVSADEEHRAKSLVRNLGEMVHRHAPLGYGDLGLLTIFPETCPNNSLPILHSGMSTWKALFPRPKN